MATIEQQLTAPVSVKRELHFHRERHVQYFLRCLKILPSHVEHYDSVRLSIAFFALSGLDVLDALDQIASQRENIINWIYHLQVQ